MESPTRWLSSLISIVFSAYMAYATLFGPYKTTIVHLALFLMAMLVVYFLSHEATGEKRTFALRALDWIMAGLSGEGSWLGDLLAFAMTASLAVMMVISRRYQGIPVMQAACLSAFLSGLIGIPFAADLAVSGPDLINLALFGLVNSSVGLVLFTLGARLLPAIETGLIGSLDAPLAPIWVWLAFAETPAKATLIGGLVVELQGRVYDGSVRTHLSRLAAKMAGE